MDEPTPEAAASPEIGDGKPIDATDRSSHPLLKTSSPLAPPTTLSHTLQAFTDRALHFLAHASNETLGACFFGLGATTYMILGRIGLVIIGVAGGIVLHATWEGVRSDHRDEETKKADLERRREVGVEIAKRALDWRASLRTVDDNLDDFKVFANQNLDFSGFEPETAIALTTFTDAIITDYVHYWYDPTLPGEETFPKSCKRTLMAFLLSLSGHLRRKRPADTFLDFVTNASSTIIVFLNELSTALSTSPNSSAEDAISTYLRMKSDSSLMYLLDQESQKSKLADAAEDILQAYLDPKAYNCPPVHAFLRQVLSQLVLGSTVALCSRPEWINDWIVYGLEESETTKEVMEIVDAGVEGRSTTSTSLPTGPVDEKHNASNDRASVSNRETTVEENSAHEHKRQISKAEEAMDEAMKEAKRLTQLMIEEDEKRAREEQLQQAALSSSEDVSDGATQGVPTPTSSQSDKERQEEDIAPWSSRHSSIAPESPISNEEKPLTPTSKQQFTSFDQLASNQQHATALDTVEKSSKEAVPLTLHNATISIFDDSVPGVKTSIKAKPTIDYLIQVEPPSSAFAGWMIARKYTDFEMLHEVLRRISVITGVPAFTNAHAELPKWKVHTKASLRSELERYLTDAVQFQSLAESEGMKRFLEKDQGLSKSPSGNMKGFGWPTPDAFGKLGGDMMNVLTKAPKQVAGGGKAVFGGVAGLVGGVAGVKRASQSQISLNKTNTNDIAVPPSGRHSPGLLVTDSYLGSWNNAPERESQENIRSSSRPALERRASKGMTASGELKPRSSVSSQRPSGDLNRSVESLTGTDTKSPAQSPLAESLEEQIKLPPPPSEIADDFVSPTQSMRKSIDTFRSNPLDSRLSTSERSEILPPTPPQQQQHKPAAIAKPESKPKEPITERETSVAIELMFAVVTELYTLSSAWNIRRTLLTAAKTFLLRPGNPQLLTIRELLQKSLLDSNLSDSGIASHVYKLRENALPTVAELEAWARNYPEKNDEQKEELRVKARRLLVTKGMPQALTSVMGAAASGEALGKVFDCLQVPDVSRGLIFGLVLQALRIITH